jgi:DhnA family fructose-bisphosphate aldolase class Ia
MNDSDDPRDIVAESSSARWKWVASSPGILAKEKHAVAGERIACLLRLNLKRSQLSRTEMRRKIVL